MPSPGSDERASSITAREFALRRKGFDPDEVRAYLGQLAEVVGRLSAELDEARAEVAELKAAAESRPVVDEDQLTAALGEETARVLSSARHAANEVRERAETESREVRERAEESAARLVREATEAAATTRREAEAEAERIGEEARRAQEAASEASRTVVAEASADAERIRAQAEAEATRLRQEAEAVLDVRTQEAEAAAGEIRAAAEADAGLRAAEAEADAAEIRAAAEADREAARAQGREMVAEAQRVRERMLADLARRRKAARVQLEQLQGARDRLLDSYDAVQRTIDEATAGLRTALPAARTAAEAARLRAEAEPEATIDQLEAQIAAARAAGLPLVAPTGETGEPITDEVPITEVEAVTAPDPVSVEGEPDLVSVEGEPDLVSVEGEPDLVSVEGEPVEEGEVDDLAAEAPAVEPAEGAPPVEPAPEVAAVPGLDPADDAEPAVDPDAEPAVDTDADPAVEDIFARLKASRDDGEPVAEAIEEPHPTQEGADPTTGGDTDPTGVDPEQAELAQAAETAPAEADSADEALVTLMERRDGMVEPIEARLARRLKRALADEQGQVLEAVRRARRPVDLDGILPPDDQAGGYALAALEDLRAAAEEGATFEGAVLPASASAAVEGIAEDLGRELAGVVRPRVTRCFEAGEDPEDTSDRLRATYREWKTDRIVEVTRHLVLAAFGAGQAAVRPAGAPVRWMPDPDHPACPDCEDDALAGTVPSGQPFPTGHTHPPAHPGCRCLAVTEPVPAAV